ncbi:MAG: hydroxymethylglutaryl-CoA lyase [Vampirovibrionales bacterium]|nr:hydroxymethylglutaryl-CoA lyase [Vampirovibrionales bacterium]
MKKVRIVEVGPRDGLQNQKALIDAGDKIALIQKLEETGLKDIEITSFVSPKAIPQLADSVEVARGVLTIARPDVTYWALTPNLKGFENALAAGIRHVAVFTAASETFNRNNINKSIAESFEAFKPVIAAARQNGCVVRGYVSTAFWCPYEGKIDPQKTVDVTRTLYEMGVSELSIGDTIGKATPEEVRQLLQPLASVIPIKHIAMHFHDTYGHALENIKASLALGVSVYDSSVAGVGGCPYAPGASGNVATEAVVRLMNSLGIDTGVDLAKLETTGRWLQDVLLKTSNPAAAG